MEDGQIHIECLIGNPISDNCKLVSLVLYEREQYSEWKVMQIFEVQICVSNS